MQFHAILRKRFTLSSDPTPVPVARMALMIVMDVIDGGK